MDDQGVGGQEWLSAPDLQRRAIAGSMWTAVHTVVTLPVAFVANAILARSLGVSSYGHLAFLSAARATMQHPLKQSESRNKSSSVVISSCWHGEATWVEAPPFADR